MFVDSVFRENQNVMDLLDGELHVSERAPRAASTASRTSRATVPPRDADRFESLRPAGQGRGADGHLVSEPHGAGAARRVDSREHHRHAAGGAAAERRRSSRMRVAGEKPKTMRELMAAHRKQSSCFACHGVLDPLGFALENFDAVGVWRTKDRLAGDAIDCERRAARWHEDQRPGRPAQCAAWPNPDQFVQTLTEKLMTYALGPHRRVSRHADGPRDRARQRRRTTTGSRPS